MSKVNLPDFDDMFELVEQIKELSIKESLLTIRIKNKEAEITKEATSNPEYFNNGKAPSQTFIDSSWKYSGFNGELIPAREELARTTAELYKARNTFDLYRLIIDVWRTEEANKRVSVSV